MGFVTFSLVYIKRKHTSLLPQRKEGEGKPSKVGTGLRLPTPGVSRQDTLDRISRSDRSLSAVVLSFTVDTVLTTVLNTETGTSLPLIGYNRRSTDILIQSFHTMKIIRKETRVIFGSCSQTQCTIRILVFVTIHKIL